MSGVCMAANEGLTQANICCLALAPVHHRGMDAWSSARADPGSTLHPPSVQSVLAAVSMLSDSQPLHMMPHVQVNGDEQVGAPERRASLALHPKAVSMQSGS